MQEYAKDEDKIRKGTFNSLGGTINSSCFFELITCSRPNKILLKTFDTSRTLREIALSIAEGTSTANIDNFINAIKITEGEINGIALVTKHQNKTCEVT